MSEQALNVAAIEDLLADDAPGEWVEYDGSGKPEDAPSHVEVELRNGFRRCLDSYEIRWTPDPKGFHYVGPDCDIVRWRPRKRPATSHQLAIYVPALVQRVRELEAERDTPEVVEFSRGVAFEVVHQRARWGASHDAGKQPEDWLFLVGYLAGKACAAARIGDTDKALHHTISTAAALANWHAALSGADTRMRPGIDPAETSDRNRYRSPDRETLDEIGRKPA